MEGPSICKQSVLKSSLVAKSEPTHLQVGCLQQLNFPLNHLEHDGHVRIMAFEFFISDGPVASRHFIRPIYTSLALLHQCHQCLRFL
jgi:hypothetical protein